MNKIKELELELKRLRAEVLKSREMSKQIKGNYEDILKNIKPNKMNNLNEQQKEILNQWFNENYDGEYQFDFAKYLDNETHQKITDLNPETSYVDIRSYLQELVEELELRNTEE